MYTEEIQENVHGKEGRYTSKEKQGIQRNKGGSGITGTSKVLPVGGSGF